MDILRKVIDIKKSGNAALILLADFINKSINNQINKFISKDKIQYSQILEQLNNLILIYRQNAPTFASSQATQILTTDDIDVLTQTNRYFNVHNRSIKSEYNFSNKMTGKGTIDFNNYFTVLEKYINGIRNISQNMSIVDNFASLFTLIAANEGSEDVTKDSIKRYLTEYLISSMIDVNESVIDLDFDISL